MRKIKGFTLIELMIAMAIVGILAAVAVPGYREQVRKSRRADAEVALTAFANAMERRFTLNNTYCDLGGAGGTDTCGDAGAGINDTGSPNFFPTEAPLDGAEKFYDLTISAVTASSYTLTAAPKAGSDQDNEKCGALTLTNVGVRGADINVADCWQ